MLKNTSISLEKIMNNAIILDEKDIKKMIAEKYAVDEKDIIKSQYSYIVKLSSDNCKEE